jgi:hypothetical protein
MGLGNGLEALALKVPVKRERPGDPLPAHQLEADSVHERRAPAGPGEERAGGLCVQGLTHELHGAYRKQVIDESPNRLDSETPVKERDGFGDDVGVGHELLVVVGGKVLEPPACTAVPEVAFIEKGNERGGVDERGQRRSSS